MRLFHKSELRGYLIILFVVIALGILLLALTGKLQKRLGINISFGGTYDLIAFVSDRNGSPDIWLMELDGSNPHPLTNDKATDGQPDWSPDGKRIMFVSDRSEDNAQVYVIRSDGSNLRQVTSSTGTKTFPSFSPDGFSIAYMTGGRVFTADLTGGHEEPILPTVQQAQNYEMMGVKRPYKFICWASDSKTLGTIQDAEGIQVPYVVFHSGDEPTIVADLDDHPMVAEKVSIAWSKKDLKLALALATKQKRHILAIRDYDKDDFETLLQMEGDIGPDSLDWSPDSSAIAVGVASITKDGLAIPAGVVIIDTDSGEISSVADGFAGDPKWSPDGGSILYTMEKNGKTDIWKYDLESKKSSNLTGGKGNNHSPAWGPSRRSTNGKQVGLSGSPANTLPRKQT